MGLRVKGIGIDHRRVQRARIEAGLSQAELARAIGCSARSVQYWESPGGVRRPNTRLLRLLAEATNRPIHWFYGEQAA